MGNRMEMIFTREEIQRITEDIRNNVHTLTVDVHGLRVKEAKRLLNNLMSINREGYNICVIHGYNHGTAIKEMIHGKLNNPRMEEKKGGKGNYGRTVLKMREAA